MKMVKKNIKKFSLIFCLIFMTMSSMHYIVSCLLIFTNLTDILEALHFYGDSRYETFQKTENTLNLGTGYSDTECALRCKLKNKRHFVKVEKTGECLCDDHFVKIKEECDDLSENVNGVIFEVRFIKSSF